MRPPASFMTCRWRANPISDRLCCLAGSRSFPPFTVQRYRVNGSTKRPRRLPMVFLLEPLLQSHRDHATEQTLEDVAGTRKTATCGDLIFVGCSLIRDVLYDDLDTDVPQVLVRGP